MLLQDVAVSVKLYSTDSKRLFTTLQEEDVQSQSQQSLTVATDAGRGLTAE